MAATATSTAGVGAPRRDQNLEALVAGEIENHARVVRIVLDHQQDAVAGLDIHPIVGNVLDRPIGWRGRQAVRCGRLHRARRSDGVGWTNVFHRQVKHECRALARRAVQLNFAAEQICQFAADGEAQPGAAVLAAGRSVGLLERLKDDLLLFQRNADAGVGHFKGNHAG